MKQVKHAWALPVITALMALSVSQTAYADDTGERLEADYCGSAAGIVEMVAKFDSLKPDKRDTVVARLNVNLILGESEPMPDSIELRDGETVLPLKFDETNRSIGFIDQIRQVTETAKLCITDPARAGRTRQERGFELNTSMSVQFKDTPGTHSLAQLEDGLKDGRSHYKKLAGAMGFMVPKFDYISVWGADGANPPRVWATAEGADVGEPDYELYNGARLIALKTLEAMGADGVRIVDPDYRMSPSPDAKTIAKFTG